MNYVVDNDPMPYISGSTGERVRQIPPGREADFYYLPRIEYKEKDVQLTEDQQ